MSETEKKQNPAAKRTATKTEGKKPKAVIYIGPDIPGAKQYTTYNNGLPDALKEKIKEHPFFNSLVIPVERMAWANAQLAKEGSALNILYQKASAVRKK